MDINFKENFTNVNLGIKEVNMKQGKIDISLDLTFDFSEIDKVIKLIKLGGYNPKLDLSLDIKKQGD